MRITSVNIAAADAQDEGLKDIMMTRLGKVVLIAGKNGAGKSRLLRKIKLELGQKPTKSQLETAKQGLDQENRNNQLWQNSLEQILSQPVKERSPTDQDIYIKAIKSSEVSIKNWEDVLTWNKIEIDTPREQKYEAIDFVPKSLGLDDPSISSNRKIVTGIMHLKQPGIRYLQNSLMLIQGVQNEWREATHPNSELAETTIQEIKRDYKNLQDIIKLILNTSIGRDRSGNATIFGLPVGSSLLSDGQKILIQFCAALYCQGSNLRESILFLDEPENHLHPSVIIDVIDRISNSAFDGQIWIATHSIPLLAHFDPSSLWYIEDGKVSHAGKTPEKVLKGLLGGDEQVSKLQDLISLPAQFATSRHAFECLFQPEAVVTGASDPQPKQIRNQLLSIVKEGKLKILEYGVGKARVISNINDLDKTGSQSVVDKLDFVGYDKYKGDKEICEATIASIYGTSEGRYYNDMSSLLSDHDKKSFQVVLMSNVLHEIDPNDWLKLFAEGGEISSLLADDGYLLLVEDHQMQIGEKAYQKGFIVLDTPQLKELFKIPSSDTRFSWRGDLNGRLKAHFIPKERLMSITADTRKEALQSLSRQAREEILKVREADKNYVNGKIHGFWTQQFANTQLSLAQLTT